MIRLVSKKFCNLRPIRRTALAQTIVFESKKKREHWDERNFRLVKWISLISVGTLGSVLGYKIFKKYNFVFPSVKAATVSENSAVNHRAKFNFIADVVSTSKNSVVYIEIKDKRRSDFFMGQPAVVSNGSGFVVDSNGLILTNAHVVLNKPNTVVQVKLFDGRVFDGVIDSVDAQSDLATIRIACNNLPAIKLGKSSDIKAGEWVVAMGSPLALSNTVTAGVVSSTQRPSEELGLRGRNINYIQTDAAITFGNSGGPLVNLDGEAIGINSMKLTAGISFAIPIDYAKEFLAKAAERRQFGKPERDKVAVRRYLGITMLSLTPDILHELKQRSHEVPNHIRHGILVWKVIIGSPAHSSGLMPGDIIVDIDGVAVKNSQDIYDILASSDKNINMTIYRGPTLLRIVVRPEEL